MSSTNQLVSLRDIPRRLFFELAHQNVPEEKGKFTQTGGSFSVTVGRAKKAGPNGPHTLVLKDKKCGYGRWHHTSLMVFNFPAEVGHFDPSYEGFPPGYLMQIRFQAENHMPGCGLTPKWESGKGFWINELLTAEYGRRNHDVSIISRHDDWEFGFLIEIQQLAHKFASEATIRGHWEYEWNPKGDYSVQPR